MKKRYSNINEEMNRIKSLFTEERLYGNLIVEQGTSGPAGFKTKEEGDAFRKWVHEDPARLKKVNDAIKAKGLTDTKLDKTGGFNNDYIKTALSAVGATYKSKSSGGPSFATLSTDDKTKVTTDDKTKVTTDDKTKVTTTDDKTKVTTTDDKTKVTTTDDKTEEEIAAEKEAAEKVAAEKAQADKDKELSGEIDFDDIDRKIKRGVIQDKKTEISDNKDQLQEKFRNCKDTIKKVSILDSGKRSVSIDEYVEKGMAGASEGAIAKKASDFKNVISGCLSNKHFGEKFKGKLSDEWIKNNGITVAPQGEKEGDIFTIKERGRTIGKIKKLGDNEYRLVGGPKVAFLKPKSKDLWRNKIPAIVAAIGKTGTIEKTSKGSRGSKDKFDFKVV